MKGNIYKAFFFVQFFLRFNKCPKRLKVRVVASGLGSYETWQYLGIKVGKCGLCGLDRYCFCTCNGQDPISSANLRYIHWPFKAMHDRFPQMALLTHSDTNYIKKAQYKFSDTLFELTWQLLFTYPISMVLR